MLKGRLGIDDARIPEKSRHGAVYLEFGRVAIEDGCLVFERERADTVVEIPQRMLNALMLGPGTTVTHDAVRHLSAHGTCVMFVGRDGTRIYSAPPIFDRKADLARRQATYWASESTRMLVARRMYEKRFGQAPRVSTLDALRGHEAARIKAAYDGIAKRLEVPWKGRRYDPSDPGTADIPNQAINHVVTALEGIVSTAVQMTATIPQLGFLHEESSKAWVLDLNDLYRTTVTIPIAFGVAKRIIEDESIPIDRECRREMARFARKNGFFDMIVDDITELLA